MIQIVLVEKDPSVAWLYREELEDAGFEVCVHTRMESAVGDLRGRPGRVLVTDVSTVDGPPEKWLPGLRAVYGGPVVLLSSGPSKALRCMGVPIVRKSSDVAPLINSLRGQSCKILWSQTTSGTC